MVQYKVDKLKECLGKLQSDIEEFKPYSDSFINNTVSELEKFNSDFISEIKDTMENMTDTKAKDLISKMEDFNNTLDETIKNIEESQQQIADGIKMHD